MQSEGQDGGKIVVTSMKKQEQPWTSMKRRNQSYRNNTNMSENDGAAPKSLKSIKATTQATAQATDTHRSTTDRYIPQATED